jgi:glycosyltransferase involved in cell wall biosynthesis
VSDYSVVIPAYNAAATIAEALESVFAQTAAPDEVIVVDDGSTDSTVDIVRACGDRVRLIRQENAGPGSATTRGISEVRSPIIATLDADDLWLPEKCERQLAALVENPGISTVFARYRPFRDRKEPGPTVLDGWIRSAMMVRTDVARANGPIIDPPAFTGDMVDWLGRLKERGEVLHLLTDVLLLRRIRPGSLTYGQDAEGRRGYLKVVNDALKRRRERNSGK